MFFWGGSKNASSAWVALEVLVGLVVLINDLHQGFPITEAGRGVMTGHQKLTSPEQGICLEGQEHILGVRSLHLVIFDTFCIWVVQPPKYGFIPSNMRPFHHFKLKTIAL